MKQFVLILALSFAHQVYAGEGVDGGGGMAVVCANSSGTETAELLDLYEARQNPKIQVMQPSGDIVEDHARMTNNSIRLQGSTNRLESKDYANNVRHMLDLIDWHDGPAKLPFTNDQGRTVALPTQCKLEQLAIFYDTQVRMKVDRKLWNQLDSLSQAGLLKHESIYWNDRQSNQINSEITRSYVAQAASTGFTARDEGISSAQDYCSAWSGALGTYGDSNSFYVHRMVKNSVEQDTVFQFKFLADRHMLVKTTALFKNLVFDTKTVKDSFGQDTAVPVSTVVNKRIRTKIETDHHDQLEAELKFVAGLPIELTVLQSGREISKAILHECGPVTR